MNEKNMKKYEIIFGLILISLGIFMITYSQKFPKFISMGKILPGPSFFPTILGILFNFIGIYFVLENLLKLRMTKMEKDYISSKINLKDLIKDYNFQNFLIFLFLTIFYPTLINYVGFYIGTFIFCLFLMKRLKVGWLTGIISSVLIIIIIHIIFYKIAFIPLPEGYIFRR